MAPGQWIPLDEATDIETAEQVSILLTPTHETRGRLMSAESRPGYARVWLPSEGEAREYARRIVRVMR